MVNNINEYDIPWWEKYDGDIEEERRKVMECVSEIEDPEERQEKYEDLLNAIEYNEYYAYNPNMKSESYLINLRKLRLYEDEDGEDFFHRILDYSEMDRCSEKSAENILVLNINKKFTFLNSTRKTISKDEIIKKLKIEYSNEWSEDDESHEFMQVPVKSY